MCFAALAAKSVHPPHIQGFTIMLMPSSCRLLLPAVMCSMILSTNAMAQGSPWQSHMDLMTAGAAASVVLHHGCIDQAATNAATIKAAKRLQILAMGTNEPEKAYQYASDAFDIKVKALWQSTHGKCRNMQRLQHMAMSTGFAVPNN